MSESAVYRPHLEAPAEAKLDSGPAAPSPPADQDDWAGLRIDRFEVVSRGDFVPGILYRPTDATEIAAPADKATPKTPETERPLLLLQHALGDHAQAPYLACAAAWARRGLAVASIDLALHGRRASPKLSDRLVSSIRRLAGGDTLDPNSFALVEEFARQTTSDLIRTLDALSARSDIDANRIGFMGFGLGAVAGSYLLAHDSRPRATVLVVAGGLQGESTSLGPFDAMTYLERASARIKDHDGPRSLLMVANDAITKKAEKSLGALFRSAPDPKELHRFKGKTRELPEASRQRIEDFLREALGLSTQA